MRNVRMLKSSMWVAIATIGLATLLIAANVNPPFNENVEFESAQPDGISREKRMSSHEISAAELNEFHLALLARVLLKLPARLGLSVDYQGIVRDRGHTNIKGIKGKDTLSLRLGRGQRVHGDIGAPLEWTVSDQQNDVIFSIWVSVRKTKESIAECRLAKRTLFVNIDGADKSAKALGKKLDKLGGRSILDVVGLLKAGASELEKR